MYSPVTRLMLALNLLQSRPSITALQLAERLEVNTRSVRRYITMLQDLGIPVEAGRGRYGGYRLRPGYKLPPLMWSEEEAVAITLGLQAVRQLGLSSVLPTVESALAKVERVLPLPLRDQVRAMQETITLDLKSRENLSQEQSLYLTTLSYAAHSGQRLSLEYQGKTGVRTERQFDCYGVLYHEMRWYTVGFCHLRQEIRIFRLDRISRLEPGKGTFKPPEQFDCLSYALQSFAAIPSRWLVEVILEIKAEVEPETLDRVRNMVPATFATLEETPQGLLLRAYDDDLTHAARFLVSLGCPLKIIGPPELRTVLHQLAREIGSY